MYMPDVGCTGKLQLITSNKIYPISIIGIINAIHQISINVKRRNNFFLFLFTEVPHGPPNLFVMWIVLCVVVVFAL